MTYSFIYIIVLFKTRHYRQIYCFWKQWPVLTVWAIWLFAKCCFRQLERYYITKYFFVFALYLFVSIDLNYNPYLLKMSLKSYTPKLTFLLKFFTEGFVQNTFKGHILYSFLEFYFRFDVLKNIYICGISTKNNIFFYSSSLRSSAEYRSILACLINIHKPLFWLACFFLSDARLGQPQVTRVM